MVYIDIETLRDSYGKATASMHKAYEMLIENYNVYVLAPSSTNNPQAMVDDVKWVEEYLSAPAWGRVIFSNERQLQYGDYQLPSCASSSRTRLFSIFNHSFIQLLHLQHTFAILSAHSIGMPSAVATRRFLMVSVSSCPMRFSRL